MLGAPAPWACQNANGLAAFVRPAFEVEPCRGGGGGGARPFSSMDEAPAGADLRGGRGGMPICCCCCWAGGTAGVDFVRSVAGGAPAAERAELLGKDDESVGGSCDFARFRNGLVLELTDGARLGFGGRVGPLSVEVDVDAEAKMEFDEVEGTGGGVGEGEASIRFTSREVLRE